MKSKSNTAVLCMVFSTLVFGTVGIFVRGAALPSSLIALIRGVTGSVFLFVFSFFRKTPIDKKAIKAKA